MSRDHLRRIVATCRKGINQNPEEAGIHEAADALNVWAPDGRIEQRPGYTGVSIFGIGGIGAAHSARRARVADLVGNFTEIGRAHV